MAKKRFTDDLMGLFEEPAAPAPTRAEAAPVRGTEPSPPDQQEESVEVEVPTVSKRARKKLSSKGFTADLDAFLSDSFEREGQRSASAPSTSNAPAPAPRPRRRKTGLDLLIRSTVAEEDRGPRGKTAADTKRVTLIFNKEHLLTLKEQAKDRGMYLKDVVQEMVADYLEK